MSSFSLKEYRRRRKKKGKETGYWVWDEKKIIRPKVYTSLTIEDITVLSLSILSTLKLYVTNCQYNKFNN